MTHAPLHHDTVAEHERTSRWLVAFSSGLLDEARETMLREHLDGCADCRRELEALRRVESGAPVAPRHIPAAVIATWPRASAAARGLERRALERHLASCDSCRAELVRLGHVPSLPALPPRRAIARQDAPAPARAAHDWLRWAFGGWALAATAAAAVLFASNPQLMRSMPAAGVFAPLEPGAAGDAGVRLRLSPIRELAAAGPAAGAPDALPTYELGAGRQVLVLAPLALPAQPASARARLDVLDARDSVLASSRVPLAELAGRALPIETGEHGLPSGTYWLRVRIEAPQGVAERELRFPFRVERRP